MKRLCLHIALLLVASLTSVAQTTFIPDTNFRKILKYRYPQFGFLDLNDRLINSRAATYNGTIDCSYSNVSDLTSIEKFNSLTVLACQHNNISNLDSIAKLRNLTTIYCFNNRLSHLPSLAGMPNLSYLSCGSNEITLLDLSNNSLLFYLDASSNKLTSVKGLEKLLNLETLLLFRNHLSTLGDLSKLIKLGRLEVHNNQLTEIRGLSKMTQLSTLIAGANPYTQLEDMSSLSKMSMLFLWNSNLNAAPNVSTMTGLTQLDLNSNNIKVLPNFSTNPNLFLLKVVDNQLDSLPMGLSKLKLKYLHASANRLVSAPELPSSKASLLVLALEKNRLKTLPDLTGFTSLDTVTVDSNYLSFEDVLPLIKITGAPYLKYAPQYPVGKSTDTLLLQQHAFVHVLGIDKALTTNTYTWLKDGTPYKTPLTTDTLAFPNVQLGDSGTYTCQVTNSNVSGLTLTSSPLRVKTAKCLDLSILAFTTTEVQCQVGGTVSIQESSIKYGQKPYSYTLTGTETGKKHLSSSPTFSNLFELNYQLEISDGVGCKAGSAVTLKGKTAKDCKGLIIVGDVLSPNNNLFFDEQGTARVYDKTGQLVQTLSTPASWDGTNQHGEFLPGYYVVDLNGKMLNVTLIK